jgi:hypothetical protein
MLDDLVLKTTKTKASGAHPHFFHFTDEYPTKAFFLANAPNAEMRTLMPSLEAIIFAGQLPTEEVNAAIC